MLHFQAYNVTFFIYLFFLFVFRELTAPDGSKSRTIRFGKIEIQGGGEIEVQSDVDGLSIVCTSLWLRSGGRLRADRLKLDVVSVNIEQSGLIDLNFQV